VRFICAVLAFFCAVVPASATAAEPIDAYAAALRAFNAELGAGQSVLLAHRLIAEADAHGLDARLLVAVIAVESRWQPGAVSRAGARGLGQFMPATAAGIGIDPFDPEQSIAGVALHLRALLDRYASAGRQEQYVDALAAYNAGAGAVARYGGVPPYAETQTYVRRVISLWRRLAGTP
jgi:soluble lytic murein transglycosylase-like protein